MFKRILSLILSSALLLACGAGALAEGAEVRRGADNGEKLRIACVGDSVTWGNQVTDDKGTSYPSFLQVLLGNRAEVRNFGYPGACVTKNQGLSYINGTNTDTFFQGMYQKSLDYKADVVILCMGGNDSQRPIWGVGTFEKDYEELVNAYRNQGNDPLILIVTGGYCIESEEYAKTWGVPGKSTIGKWGEDDDTLKNLIQPAQQRVSAKYGIPTLDLRALLMSDPDAYISKVDGVHYTDAGYRDEAQMIHDALLPLVELPGGGEEDGSMPDPTSLNGVEIGEYDGQRCVIWEKGTKGGFAYDGGMLSYVMGIPAGTVVKELTIKVSYLWDYHAGGNDWWWFNTTDRDGLSAPGIANGNPHDNGFGTFDQYKLTKGQWSELTVSRADQTLGGNDWSVSVGDLNGANSLYFRGWHIEVTLADGAVKTADWGCYTVKEAVDKTELENEISAFIADVVYTEETFAAYNQAMEEARAVLANGEATQEEVDAAAAALKAAREGLVIQTGPAALTGDADADGKITSTDARLTLQLSVEKIKEADVPHPEVIDVDHDGSITSTDARLILQYSVDKIAQWP